MNESIPEIEPGSTSFNRKLSRLLADVEMADDGWTAKCPICQRLTLHVPYEGYSDCDSDTCGGEELFETLCELVEAYFKNTNPFATNAVSAADIPPARDPQRLWFGLYPRTVVLMVGETGAGKSSLLYNIAVHAALNLPLFGVPFSLNRPLRVLYIDPENSSDFKAGNGGLCAVKLERIDKGRPGNLFFYDGGHIDLSGASDMLLLQEYLLYNNIALVIIDPIASLFNTQNEDDNAEAARQMKSLIRLSRVTGVCIVAVHHSGKTPTGDYGRGASARLAAADVGMLLRVKGNQDWDDTFNGELHERTDLVRLQLSKNRLEGNASLYLQMDGEDQFTVSTYAEWQKNSGDKPSKTEKAQENILSLLADKKPHSRADIVETMKKNQIGESTVDTALKSLVEAGKIVCDRSGRGGALQYKLC